VNLQKIIDEVLIKDRPLIDDGREIMILEIMEHQKFLRKGVPRASIMQLTRLTDKELAIMLEDAFFLFAYRFFNECGREPNPHTNLINI
jgi:hypothetical protein